jgi:hypothetical protein
MTNEGANYEEFLNRTPQHEHTLDNIYKKCTKSIRELIKSLDDLREQAEIIRGSTFSNSEWETSRNAMIYRTLITEGFKDEKDTDPNTARIILHAVQTLDGMMAAMISHAQYDVAHSYNEDIEKTKSDFKHFAVVLHGIRLATDLALGDLTKNHLSKYSELLTKEQMEHELDAAIELLEKVAEDKPDS